MGYGSIVECWLSVCKACFNLWPLKKITARYSRNFTFVYLCIWLLRGIPFTDVSITRTETAKACANMHGQWKISQHPPLGYLIFLLLNLDMCSYKQKKQSSEVTHSSYPSVLFQFLTQSHKTNKSDKPLPIDSTIILSLILTCLVVALWLSSDQRTCVLKTESPWHFIYVFGP